MILVSNTKQHKEKHIHIGRRQKIKKCNREEKQRRVAQMLLEKENGLQVG
jgi:hypothetical protein